VVHVVRNGKHEAALEDQLELLTICERIFSWMQTGSDWDEVQWHAFLGDRAKLWVP
jgi:hypothetical protein